MTPKDPHSAKVLLWITMDESGVSGLIQPDLARFTGWLELIALLERRAYARATEDGPLA